MRTMRATALGITTLVLALLAGACAPAGAAGTWEALPAPPAPGASTPVIDVQDVACGSPSSCVALPTRADAAGRRWGVAWDGSQWTPIPSPADNVYELDCVGDWCLATSGPVDDTPTSHTWTWDGTAWARHEPPALVTYELDCASPTLCVAIGGNGESGSGAFRWDGATWAPITDRRPSADSFYLSDVACATDGSCRFITRSSSAGDVNQLEQWAGGTWTVTAPVGGDRLVKANHIACGASATSCRVGATVAPAAGGSRWWGSLRWDGGGWTQETVPASGFVGPIHCGADDTCVAFAGGRTLTFEGGAWRDAAPVPADLAEVSCASARWCVSRVVRPWDAPADAPQSFHHWDGTTWTQVDAGAAPATADAGFVGVACPAETWCLGIGRYGAGGSDRALLEQFDGSRWTVGPELPVALAGAELRSVACTAKEQCVVVGRREDGPFLARLRGSVWTDESAPFAALAPGAILNDVWCGGGTCIVVSPSGNSGLAFRSTGGVWSSMPAPAIPQAMPAPGRTNMQIDCASPTSCAVSGVYLGSQAVASVSYWNGTSWSDPAATGGQLANAFISGVACPVAGTCVATGLRSGSSSVEGLALTWNGAAWVADALPHPLGPVSCSADRCVATADGAVGPGGLRGAVRSGGRWTTMAEPVPAVPDGGRVGDVSCVPGGPVCVAAGSAPGAPFAYRWRF